MILILPDFATCPTVAMLYFPQIAHASGSTRRTHTTLREAVATMATTFTASDTDPPYGESQREPHREPACPEPAMLMRNVHVCVREWNEMWTVRMPMWDPPRRVVVASSFRRGRCPSPRVLVPCCVFPIGGFIWDWLGKLARLASAQTCRISRTALK
jgi:hypothetical protein